MRIDIFTAVSANGIVAPYDKDFFMSHTTLRLQNFRKLFRDKYDAIIVGANTILKHNPTLLNTNKNNFRIIIDIRQNLPIDSNVFTIQPQNTLLVISSMLSDTKYIRERENLGVRIYPFRENGLVSVLNGLNLKNILIEGGINTIKEFLDLNCISCVHLVIFPFFTKGEGNIWKILFNHKAMLSNWSLNLVGSLFLRIKICCKKVF